MPMTNFPSGFTDGITVRGVPLLQSHPGKVVWVGNSSVLSPRENRTGSDNNRGTFNSPFATIARALDECTAGAGDIIMVKPGHAETIANATTLALDVADVAIIGLGAGSKRPTLTFSTAATANIPVTAANVSIQNFLFVANFADVASVFTATGTATPTDLCIQGCEFRDTSSILNFISIVTGNATANSMDGLSFNGNRISSLGTTAATTAIKILSASKRVTINDNFGAWAVLNNTAAMLAAGANNITDFQFARNIITRPNTSTTSGLAISCSGTAWTGFCHDNRIFGLNNTAQIWINTGTKLGFAENYCPITAAADRSGLINPAAV
jgi:hypothetical protein